MAVVTEASETPMEKCRKPGVPTLMALGLAVVLAPADAHAYIDAGTGSMIVQAVIAAIAGAGVMGRMYWSKIKVAFGRGGEQIEDEAESTPIE